MVVFKTIMFSVIVPGTVVGLVPYFLLTRISVFPPIDLGLSRYLGVLPMIAGIIFYATSARSFVVQGKGTPAPIDPPRLLVATGPYRIVRNPMYAGGILVLLGEAILLGSLVVLAYLFLVWLAFHLFVVFYEEPHLRKLFGPAYLKYCDSVSRWLPSFLNPSRKEK